MYKCQFGKYLLRGDPCIETDLELGQGDYLTRCFCILEITRQQRNRVSSAHIGTFCSVTAFKELFSSRNMGANSSYFFPVIMSLISDLIG